jgi:hypothetical protein
LANSDLVTVLNTESRADVGGQVLVSSLVTGVFGDEVEVFPADDQGTVHLGGDDGAGKDTATDGDETCEGALLVCEEEITLVSVVHVILYPSRPSSILCRIQSRAHLSYRHSSTSFNTQIPRTDVRTLNGGLGRPEAQTDILVPSPATLSDSLLLGAGLLGVLEDVRLLLESALALDGQFGSHVCGEQSWLVGWRVVVVVLESQQ